MTGLLPQLAALADLLALLESLFAPSPVPYARMLDARPLSRHSKPVDDTDLSKTGGARPAQVASFWLLGPLQTQTQRMTPSAFTSASPARAWCGCLAKGTLPSWRSPAFVNAALSTFLDAQAQPTASQTG